MRPNYLRELTSQLVFPRCCKAVPLLPPGTPHRSLGFARIRGRDNPGSDGSLAVGRPGCQSGRTLARRNPGYHKLARPGVAGSFVGRLSDEEETL